MGRLVKTWIPSIIAVVACGATLVGYLFPGASPLTADLVDWAVIVAAFALLMGMLNILRVHGRTITRAQKGSPNSLVLLLAALITLVVSVLDMPRATGDAPSGTPTTWIFNYVISPVGASLAALLAFTLALSVVRVMRTQRNLRTGLFVLVVLVTLLGSTPLLGFQANPLPLLRDWIVNVPALAGMRGLLLGVVLGVVITALRVLFSFDRPHSES